MKTASSRFFVVLLAFLFCTMLGCTAMYRAQYKTDYVHNQMQSYTHTTEFTRLWTEARTLLFESGFVVRDSGNGYNVETEWGYIGDNTRRRYLLVGYTADSGTSTIQFNYIEEIHNEGVRPSQRSGRDYNMEYELLRRVNYNQWLEIEQAAESYANAKVQK